MSSKKRSSEIQISKDEDFSEDSDSNEEPEGIPRGWEAASAEELSSRRILKAKLPSSVIAGLEANVTTNPFLGISLPAPAPTSKPTLPELNAAPTFGFSAYASTNPFTSAASKNNPFSAFANAAKKTFGEGPTSFMNPKGLTIDSSALNNNDIATADSADRGSNSRLTPQTTTPNTPQTPKAPNPFSSSSNKTNPFVKIVDQAKDGDWFPKPPSSSSLSSSTDPAVSIVQLDGSAPVAGDASAIAPVKSFFASYKTKETTNKPLRPTAFGSGSIPTWGMSSSSLASTDGADTSDRDASVLKNSRESDVDDDGVNEAGGDGDAIQEEGVETKKIIDLPDNVVVVTGEENETCIIEVRGKLYRWAIKAANNAADTSVTSVGIEGIKQQDDDSAKDQLYEWVEVGVGPVRLLKEAAHSVLSSASVSTTDAKDNTTSSGCESTTSTSNETDKASVRSLQKSRIVMRREERKGGHGTKLLLNAAIRGYVKISKQGDRAFRIMCLHPESEDKAPTPQTYVIKTKSPQEMTKLFDSVQAQLNDAIKVDY